MRTRHEAPHNPNTRRDLVVNWLLCLLVALFASLFAVEEIYNYDIWWHLKTGQLILETGSIPTTDPFSFSTQGSAWSPHYWLSDVLFAAVEKTAGLNGLILFKALIVAGAFFCAYRLMVSAGVDAYLAAFLAGMVVPIARFRFLLRPGVFMLLLASLFLLLITRWYPERPRRLWLLVPLCLLWTNFHASFVLAWVFVGCLLAAEAFDHFVRHRDRHRRSLVLLGGLLAGTIVVTLINPFGLELHRWVVRDFITKSVATSFEIQEHLPLKWGEHELFWTLMIATTVSFALAWPRGRVFHLLVFLFTTFLALRSVRYVAVAALLQAPILGINLHLSAERPPISWPTLRRLRAPLVLPALLVAATLCFKATFSEAKAYRFGLGVKEDRFPLDGVRLVEKIGPEGNLFNSWEFGGYLLWQRPEHRIFIDGRCLEAQLALYTATRQMSSADFEAMIDRFDITAALIKPEDGHGVERFSSSPRFEPVFFDDQSIVFLRTDVRPHQRPVEIRPFRLVRPGAYDLGYLEQLADGPLFEATEDELRHGAALAPRDFKPRFLLGYYLEARSDPAALDQYIAAADANPRLAFIHYSLGSRSARLALEQGKPAAVVRLMELAEPFGLGAEEYFLLGTALYLQGELDRSETALKKSLALREGSIEARLNLAYVYLDRNRLTRAESLFRTLVKEVPEREEALYGLALAVQRSGDLEEAARLWQQFVKSFPTGHWAERARQHLTDLDTEQGEAEKTGFTNRG